MNLNMYKEGFVVEGDAIFFGESDVRLVVKRKRDSEPIFKGKARTYKLKLTKCTVDILRKHVVSLETGIVGWFCEVIDESADPEELTCRIALCHDCKIIFTFKHKLIEQWLHGG